MAKRFQILKGIIRSFLAMLLMLSCFEIFSNENDIEVKKRTLNSKISLLGRLVQDSPAANRIMQSDNEGAKDLLKEALEEWQLATNQLQAMQIDKAEEHVKRGFMYITQASAYVADKARLQQTQKVRYSQLRERISSFLEAYQRIVDEKKTQAVSGLLDMNEINALVSEAVDLAKNDNYREANQRLSRAADNVEIALAQARHKETLLHQLSFDSPQAQYDYEKQRNHSYMLLADLIKKKKKIEPHSLERFRAALQENEARRARAEQLVGDGNIDAAITMLEEGTRKLALTLRASGVVF